MKNLKDSFLRLLIFAEHIGSEAFYENYEGLHFFYNKIKTTWIMRDTENTFLRMMVLAEHFEHGRIYEEYYGLHFFYSDDKKTLLIGRAGKYHCVFPQVICELPHLFPEFKKAEDGNITYVPAPDLNSHYSVLEFFGLEVKEFIHLFTVGGQKPEVYGGKELSIEYDLAELSKNIFEFLEQVLDKKINTSK